MSCPHEIEVGAFLVDALEPDERLRMEQHVRGCPICAREIEELGGLPALLATVPPPDVHVDAPVPSELAFQRLKKC